MAKDSGKAAKAAQEQRRAAAQAEIARRESEHTRKQWERENSWHKGMSSSNVTIWS